MVFQTPRLKCAANTFLSKPNTWEGFVRLVTQRTGLSSTANSRNRTTFSGFHIFQGDCHGLAQLRSSVFAGLHIPPGYTVIFTSAGKYAQFLSIYFRLLGLKQLFTLEAWMPMCGLGYESEKESRAKVVNTVDA